MNHEETKQKVISLEEAVKISHEKDLAEMNNLRERILDLEKKAKNIEFVSNIMVTLVGVIALGFFFSLVIISLDYFKYNEERYEKFINATKEIDRDFFRKEDANLLIDKTNKSSQIFDCLKNKGNYSAQCFVK